MANRANANDALNFVRYKFTKMTNRKSTQENIQRISRQIAEFNAELMQKSPLALLDIDLLRKYTIDLYDEVNNLRLVMKETMDHGPLTIEERKAEPAAEAESVVLVEEMRGNEDEEANKVRHTERSRSTTGPETVPTEALEALTKAEINVEAEAEVEAMVEAIVEEEVEEEMSNAQSPIPNPEIKLAAAEAKVEADAIKAALNPEEANDLAFKFSNTPIHDLKKAISIAEKFEFINSLFGGSVEKYAYSIHHINNLNNGDEAFAYLHDLRTEWKWDDEDKNFLKLANLIRRRFLG